ncbi:MAG: GNAT family N-acetyltransferase [Butyrivibrio sp.]|nr:GNAT family N-acetyltransferase [Butyrivibrio sp.]
MVSSTLFTFEIGDYAEYIPSDYITGLQLGEYIAIGCDFVDSPSGALVYEIVDGKCIVLSVCVKEDYRRIGIATNLVDRLMKNMLREGIWSVQFAYEKNLAGQQMSNFLKAYFSNCEIRCKIPEKPVKCGELESA